MVDPKVAGLTARCENCEGDFYGIGPGEFDRPILCNDCFQWFALNPVERRKFMTDWREEMEQRMADEGQEDG